MWSSLALLFIYFTFFLRFGEVEVIKLLPQDDARGCLSAFIDFYKVDDAVAAFNADIKIKVLLFLFFVYMYFILP